jgi:ubiquinone/menaquinone biosynthesis C-methylase UbiE
VIHRAAATGFARSAEAYERGRPGYPPEAILYLLGRLPHGATVLDLAAGTGKLTRPLLAHGLRVVAVEPVAEMRAALPAESQALEGTAEAIPLEHESVDGVTVGQAFHWFDADAALAEIARVLRPGGYVIVAASWGERTPFYTPAPVLKRGFANHSFETVEVGSAGEGTYFVARRPG